MSKTYDYIVVGAGISGAVVAYELAKRNAGSILILDKDFPTAGATGSCAAGIRAQFGTEFNVNLMKISLEKFEHLHEELDYPKDLIGLHQGGYLVLAYSEEEMENLKRNVEVQHKIGINTEILTPEEVHYRWPMLRLDGVVGATYHARDGHADPFYTTFAYIEAAKRLGAELRKHTPVLKLLTEGEKVVGVETPDGPIYGGNVIVAAGTWSTKLLKDIGIDIPLWAEKHEILITEPLARFLDPMVISFSKDFYAQQRPHGGFIMGISPDNPEQWFDPNDYNIQSSWHFLKKMASTILDVMPFLKDVHIVRQWAGFYDMTTDNHHIVGPIDAYDGLWILAGGSGHGFMFGPAIGMILAEWIVGEELAYDITKLNWKRFKEGKLVIEPAVVG
ncbi:MAG: FAD-binding oxidoreductase [Dictyoglomi bacterium]|nr:FAD-binding oxidoreductase [Dictyoglomota bacterium]